jgi:hypothetical protein
MQKNITFAQSSSSQLQNKDNSGWISQDVEPTDLTISHAVETLAEKAYTLSLKCGLKD